MITKKSFPKDLFISFDTNNDNNEKYMLAHRDIQEAASLDEERLVGVYQLVKVVKLSTARAEIEE